MFVAMFTPGFDVEELSLARAYDRSFQVDAEEPEGGDPPPPPPPARVHEQTSLPVRTPVEPTVDSDAAIRRWRTGKTGVAIMTAGYGAAFIGTVVGASACGLQFGSVAEEADPVACPAGVGLFVLGALAIPTGQTLMMYGGLAAADALDISQVVGWVGVGLLVGAVPAWAFPPLHAVIATAGVVCGAVQLGVAGHHIRKQGLVVVPTANGFAVASTF
jgi:hypothetical protein